jgi:hypothetical protein
VDAADTEIDARTDKPVSRDAHRLSKNYVSLPDLLDLSLDENYGATMTAVDNNQCTDGSSSDSDDAIWLDTLDQFPAPPHAITTPTAPPPRFPIIQGGAVSYTVAGCGQVEHHADVAVAGRQRIQRSSSLASNASFSRPSAIAYGYGLTSTIQHSSFPTRKILTSHHIRTQMHPPVARTRPIYNSLPHVRHRHQYFEGLDNNEHSIGVSPGSIIYRPLASLPA